MPKKFDTTKSEAIIDRFTSDPKVKARVLKHIQDTRDGKTSLQKIVAQYTKDPTLVEKIKVRARAIAAGKPVIHTTSLGANSAGHGIRAAENANKHRGAIELIVKGEVTPGTSRGGGGGGGKSSSKKRSSKRR